jgi:hypothetical protein
MGVFVFVVTLIVSAFYTNLKHHSKTTLTGCGTLPAYKTDVAPAVLALDLYSLFSS